MVSVLGVVERGLRGVGRTVFSLKGALVGLGIGAVSNEFLKAATTAEGFRSRLNVLLGSVQEGTRLFYLMSVYAGKVPFQYEEIMASATQLSGVMQGGVDEINRWMPMIGDLAAASGLSIEETTSQVIRMYSAGAASADLFRERGTLAMLGFQAGVSYSAEETRQKLMAAWEDPASRFRAATAELADDWDGLVSMMGDKWFWFRTNLMDAGPFEFMKALMSGINAHLDNNITDSREFARLLGVEVTNSLAMVAEGGGLTVQAFSGLKIVLSSLEYAFLIFQEKLWDFLRFFREGVTEVISVANVGGIFDEQLANSERILAEQNLILNQISLDKEAALAAGAWALELYDQISEKVTIYRQLVEQARLAALAGQSVSQDSPGQKPVGNLGAGGSTQNSADPFSADGGLYNSFSLTGDQAADAGPGFSLMGDGPLTVQDQFKLDSALELQVQMADIRGAEIEAAQELATLEIDQAARAAQGKIEAERQVMQMRQAAAGNAVSLLRMFSGENKVAALAAIAIEKALSIAQTYMYGKAAEMNAMASLPFPANLAMAAKIALWTKVNMGLIAATGLAQASQSMSGSQPSGYGAGTPSSPMVTTPTNVPTARDEAKPGPTYNVQILGPVYGADADELSKSLSRSLVGALAEAEAYGAH